MDYSASAQDQSLFVTDANAMEGVETYEPFWQPVPEVAVNVQLNPTIASPVDQEQQASTFNFNMPQQGLPQHSDILRAVGAFSTEIQQSVEQWKSMKSMEFSQGQTAVGPMPGGLQDSLLNSEFIPPENLASSVGGQMQVPGFEAYMLKDVPEMLSGVMPSAQTAFGQNPAADMAMPILSGFPNVSPIDSGSLQGVPPTSYEELSGFPLTHSQFRDELVKEALLDQGVLGASTVSPQSSTERSFEEPSDLCLTPPPSQDFEEPSDLALTPAPLTMDMSYAQASPLSAGYIQGMSDLALFTPPCYQTAFHQELAQDSVFTVAPPTGSVPYMDPRALVDADGDLPMMDVDMADVDNGPCATIPSGSTTIINFAVSPLYRNTARVGLEAEMDCDEDKHEMQSIEDESDALMDSDSTGSSLSDPADIETPENEKSDESDRTDEAATEKGSEYEASDDDTESDSSMSDDDGDSDYEETPKADKKSRAVSPAPAAQTVAPSQLSSSQPGSYMHLGRDELSRLLDERGLQYNNKSSVRDMRLWLRRDDVSKLPLAAAYERLDLTELRRLLDERGIQYSKHTGGWQLRHKLLMDDASITPVPSQIQSGGYGDLHINALRRLLSDRGLTYPRTTHRQGLVALLLEHDEAQNNEQWQSFDFSSSPCGIAADTPRASSESPDQAEDDASPESSCIVVGGILDDPLPPLRPFSCRICEENGPGTGMEKCTSRLQANNHAFLAKYEAPKPVSPAVRTSRHRSSNSKQGTRVRIPAVAHGAFTQSDAERTWCSRCGQTPKSEGGKDCCPNLGVRKSGRIEKKNKKKVGR